METNIIFPVSVIIPVYNVEQYLRQCIDSVINQTYKNLEIILVDDGSTDNSGKICDEYAKKDNRIKVIHKENGGLVSARNVGLDIARGEYITFVDGDDYIENNTLEEILKLLLDFNVDMVKYGIRTIYKSVSKNRVSKLEQKVYIGEEKDKLLENIIKNNDIDNSISNCLFKKSIIEKYNVRSDEKISQGEDLCFLTKYLLHSNSIFFAPNLLYYNYVQNPTSLTKKYSRKYSNDIINLIYEMLNLFESNEKGESFFNAFSFRINKLIFYMLFLQADFEFSKINEKIHENKFFISKIPSGIYNLSAKNKIDGIKYFPVYLFHDRHFYFSLFFMYILKCLYKIKIKIFL